MMNETIKIPFTWFESKRYRKSFCLMGYQLMTHLLGEASKYYPATAITRGTMLEVSTFLKRCYGKKKFGGSYYAQIRKGLTEIVEAEIITEYRIEEGHILVTFTEDFLSEIYPDMPSVEFRKK